MRNQLFASHWQAEEMSETEIFCRRKKKHFGWRMLMDKSINLAHIILVKQFANIAGFMDTCLGKTQQFDEDTEINQCPNNSSWLSALGLR